MDQSTFAERVESGVADWVEAHWETFHEGLTGEYEGSPFPCFFGSESVRAGEPLYTVVPSMTERDALLGLRDVLVEYLDVWPDHAERASLVTFFSPPQQGWGEPKYHEALWHVLQFLHIHDPAPWPEDIPTDPDDPYWEFTFAGHPMFPTCRAPFYDVRRSRYCPVGLEITFQPRELFERLEVTAETKAGQQARELIQNRIDDYDGMCPHADIGDYGQDLEWPQYMLSANPDKAPDSCPIQVTREHPKISERLDPGVSRPLPRQPSD
jgi:FPC/CPF motif-containing protein YcgG